MLRRLKRFLKSHIAIEVGIGLALLAGFIFIYFFIFWKLPSPSSLKDSKTVPLSTHIYDRNGKLLYEIFRDQNRTPVALKDLPKYVYQATIAIEDKDFYKHQGVSLVGGILRAVKEMVFTRRVQGGSTITQQLVKSALLTPARTIQRKLREIVLALWTEKVYTKDQVLEMYMNQVPYGGSSYGIEEASRKYYNKQAKDLTVDEAALLAGLPQAPSLYSPYLNPELAKNRRDEVLKAMYAQKYIDKETFDKAIAQKIEVTPITASIKAPHFVFYVKSLLEEKYGVQEVEEGGLKVKTTLDLDLQEKAEEILETEIGKLENMNVSNGAMLVTRPPTGEILVMMGSADYFATASGAFNVTTALRQPGSAIKPINYAIGLDRKLVTASTNFIDTQTCFPNPGQGPYCPVNYDGAWHGLVQLRFALGNSYNIPAVKMLGINGVTEFVASMSAFTVSSINDPSRYGLSLTLGGGEMRMTELAQAFSAFANRGVAKPLNPFIRIEDKNGKVLYQLEDPNFKEKINEPISYPNFFAVKGSKAISPETSFIISHILLDNNARSAMFGSSSYLVIPGRAVSVKTGTTDDKRDNWTIGYTPNFLTVVWVGNNDNTPMHPWLTSGITGAAPIWNKVMGKVLEKQPDLWPIRPDTVFSKQVCTTTGELMTKSGDGAESCPARFEYFIAGTEPTKPVTARMVVPVGKDDKLARPSDPEIEMKEKTIIKDKYSTYCVDCNHEGEGPKKE